MRHCPSCGRYVGPYEACPTCGARLTRRLSIRAMKVAAVVLATAGLAVFWFAATRAQAPLVQIGQVGPTMNLGYVRVQGRCSRAPTYDAGRERLSFWVEDGTGEILVAAYGAEAERIVAQGQAPAPGDQVEVAGTLRVREDLTSVTIDAPEQLRLARADPVDRDIGEIGPEDEYLRVRVRGQVRGVREPYPGLTLISVRDRTGAIPVAVSDDLVALSGVSPEVTRGQSVEVVAAVSLYRGTAQLIPASVVDIVPLEETVPFAVEESVGKLTAMDIGRWIVVRGNIVETDAFSSGVRATVDDGSGAVPVLLWQAIYDGLPGATELDVGAEVEVQGEVSSYRGKLELVPSAVSDVQVLAAPRPPVQPSPSPSPTATPTVQPIPSPTATVAPPSAVTPAVQQTPTPDLAVMAIGAITTDRAGEDVTVEGKVVDAASFSGGFKFTLEDSTGRIVLVMWHEVYDDCWDAQEINLGAKVRATGSVALYEGELQVQPDLGGEVKAIESTAAWGPPREIGSLSGEDDGARVMIEGKVLRVEGLSSAVKVFLGDGTGEVVVFIWRDILDRVARNTGLGTPGSHVRVVGTVGIYRGNMQVKPTLPNDVVVLEVP